MENLNKELNLFTVEVPLIVTRESGVNDYLDRTARARPSTSPAGWGSRSAWSASGAGRDQVEAPGAADLPLRRRRGHQHDMRAVRKDYFLDHDHSSYVDQWDWESASPPRCATLTPSRTRCADLEGDQGRRDFILKEFPSSRTRAIRSCPRSSSSCTPRRSRDVPGPAAQAARDQGHLRALPGDLIIGIGWVLKDGYPHEMRAADYDDWCTPTRTTARTSTASTATSWCGTR